MIAQSVVSCHLLKMSKVQIAQPIAFAPPRPGTGIWVDRALASWGALLGIGMTAFITSLLAPALPLGAFSPLIIAPLGASAVLLFAVPASPLAQPWAIIGGNTISALVGVTVSQFVSEPFAAIAIAVAMAIAFMSVTRSLHPPGGAVALGTVIAFKGIGPLGYFYALVPVFLNCVVIVAFGWLFHHASGHSYPHRAQAREPEIKAHGTRDSLPATRAAIQEQDVVAALADLREHYDIDQGDVVRLVRQVEARAFERMHGRPSCADIMSRDIVSVTSDTPPAEALRLLLKHDVTALPVVDAQRRVQGFIDLRGLALGRDRLDAMMRPARAVSPEMPAVDLVPIMNDSTTHPVAVIDRKAMLIGIIAPTDLLQVLASIATTFDMI